LNIKVNARHMDITEAIRDHCQEKATKLQRYYDRIINVDVIVDLDAGTPTVEVVVQASQNNTFVGKHRGQDMYGCIDNAMHKVEQQLRRYKDKVRNRKGPSHAEQLEQAEAVQEEPEKQ